MILSRLELEKRPHQERTLPFKLKNLWPVEFESTPDEWKTPSLPLTYDHISLFWIRTKIKILEVFSSTIELIGNRKQEIRTLKS